MLGLSQKKKKNIPQVSATTMITKWDQKMTK